MLDFQLKVPTAQFEALVKQIPVAERAGLSRVAGALQNIAERKVAEMRKRRIPTRREVALYNRRKRTRRSNRKPRAITASDAPAWTPTGGLGRAVAAEPVFESNDVIALTADVPYSENRHELGISYTPTSPALGVIRKYPFFADALEVVTPQAADLFADGWNEVMDAV